MKKNAVGDLIAHEKLGKGKWRVTAVTMTGGGTGHGPHDVYPDGYQLTLMREKNGKIDWKSSPLKFYQSGCFVDRVMLPFCEPITESKSSNQLADVDSIIATLTILLPRLTKPFADDVQYCIDKIKAIKNSN